jgi:hypothetical protein
VERSARPLGLALGVKRVGNGQCIVIEFDYGVQRRAAGVNVADSKAASVACDTRASEGSACDATPILTADARKCRRPSLLDLSLAGRMAGRSFDWSALHLVGLGGLEPPTSPLSGARSSHLSYRPTREDTTNNANNSTMAFQSWGIDAVIDPYRCG